MLHLKSAKLARWQIRLLCWSGALLWLSGAAWLLGESLSAAGWLGMALLLVAITGLYLKKPEAEPLPL